jgi:hypothetical protein
MSDDLKALADRLRFAAEKVGPANVVVASRYGEPIVLGHHLTDAAAILDHLAAVPGPDCDRRSWWAWHDGLADLTGEQSDGE